jgi:protein TonB
MALFSLKTEPLPAFPADARRSRARRVFLVCLGASVSLHAAMLTWLPMYTGNANSPTAGALEVQILPAQPLPVEPAPQRKSQARATETAPPRLVREQRDPVAVLPEPVSTDGPHAAVADKPDTSHSQPAEKPREVGADAAAPSVKAAYLRNPGPRYPDAARRAGEQGTVMLRVLVTREGLPGRVQVEKGSGSAHLDNAAVEAVRAWRFTPARQGGERVESWMLVPVVFRLEGAS